MAKSEVYSWRLSPQLKEELEQAARTGRKSMAELLTEIAETWLESSREPTAADDERQRRLHAAALPFIGSFQGGDPDRAENARAEIRARLARRHGR
jgi:predicted DNA-binding protein